MYHTEHIIYYSTINQQHKRTFQKSYSSPKLQQRTETLPTCENPVHKSKPKRTPYTNPRGEERENESFTNIIILQLFPTHPYTFSSAIRSASPPHFSREKAHVTITRNMRNTQFDIYVSQKGLNYLINTLLLPTYISNQRHVGRVGIIHLSRQFYYDDNDFILLCIRSEQKTNEMT